MDPRGTGQIKLPTGEKSRFSGGEGNPWNPKVQGQAPSRRKIKVLWMVDEETRGTSKVLTSKMKWSTLMDHQILLQKQKVETAVISAAPSAS